MLDLNSVYCGDCLELMQEIDDNSIDMILCDLPYGTTTCKWDSIISLELLWKQYKRIIGGNNGAIVLTCAQPFTSVLVASHIRGYKHHWIWQKTRGTGFQVAKYRPMMQTEDIIVFTANGKKVNYFPQMVKLDKPVVYSNASTSSGANFLGKLNKGKKTVTEKYPLNVIKVKQQSKPVHPTQKPVELFEYLIRTYTKPGNLVLDNCAGSGTTGVACQNLDRDFILMELDKEYCDTCCQRTGLESWSY